MLGIDLDEDFVHDSGSKNDLPIRNGWRTPRADTVIKAFNQFLHSEVLIKPLTDEMGEVQPQISKVFSCVLQRWNKIGQIALIRPPWAPDQSTSQNVHH